MDSDGVSEIWFGLLHSRFVSENLTAYVAELLTSNCASIGQSEVQCSHGRGLTMKA